MKSKNRVVYPPEFKLEAVRLVQSGKEPVAQIARRLGVARQQLYNWVRQAQSRKGQTHSDIFPGHGRQGALDAELTRLRKENAQLKEDNEILKKFKAFLAKHSR